MLPPLNGDRLEGGSLSASEMWDPSGLVCQVAGAATVPRENMRFLLLLDVSKTSGEGGIQDPVLFPRP